MKNKIQVYAKAQVVVEFMLGQPWNSDEKLDRILDVAKREAEAVIIEKLGEKFSIINAPKITVYLAETEAGK